MQGQMSPTQHNLVLVSLLLTYHLTICSDPRQLLSSRRIFRQRSAKSDLAHSYNPYHSSWANTETKPDHPPFFGYKLYLKVLPERKCWVSTESQVSLLLGLQMSELPPETLGSPRTRDGVTALLQNTSSFILSSLLFSTPSSTIP